MDAWRRWRRRRELAAALGGAHGPDGEALLRSPKSHGSIRCATVKRIKGSKQDESHRRLVIARIRAHLQRRCRVENGRVRGRDREGLAWGNSGRRGSAPARPGQSSGVAGQPAYGGAEVLARRSGWWRRARVRDDGVRGRPGPTYRAAANLGVRARVWKAGVDFAGDRRVVAPRKG